MRKLLFLPFIALIAIALSGPGAALAGTRTITWDMNPMNNQWQNAENWTPAKVPNGDRYIAAFGASTTTDVSVGVPARGLNHSETFINKILFTSGAPAYTITLLPNGKFGDFLTIEDGGIINHSGIVQNIVVSSSPTLTGPAVLHLHLAATVSENVVVTNVGATLGENGAGGGSISFHDSTNAGGATYINEGGTADGAFGGGVILYDLSTTAGATFINNPGKVSGALGGSTWIFSYFSGTVENSTFICNAATVPGAGGGSTGIQGGPINVGATYLAHGATVPEAGAGQLFIGGGYGYATFIAEGGTALGGAGALLTIYDLLDPDGYTEQNILMALGGTNGGDGGTLLLQFNTGLKTSQFQVFGNGLLDLSSLITSTTIIGSLAGDGMVKLAGHPLKVGNNNRDTTFSGVIQGSGDLTKLGTGTWTVNGTNTYVGTTYVNAGILGGSGQIPGKLTVGTGSGAGAALAPAAGSNVPTTLLIRSTLTLSPDGSFNCLLAGSGREISSDQLMANGVTIQSGAEFNLLSQVQGALSPGTVFIVLSNTSTTPIDGAFANLPDGATIPLNGSTLKASYEGNDGNDLTLTVQ